MLQKRKGIIMKTKVKVELISAVASVIVAAIGGYSIGIKIEQQNLQKQFNAAVGNSVNIMGNITELNINDIENFMLNYQDLQEQKESLIKQNAKYFDDLTQANNKIAELQSQAADIPILNYKNLALSINGEDIPINQNNSMVTIDGIDYFSREITENLVFNDQNLTIKNNTLFIGKVIEEKANLFEQHAVDHYYCDMYNAVTDSYDNIISNALVFTLYTGKIQYNLDGKYSQLRLTMSMSEDAASNAEGILTIKADDKLVYTSPTFSKTSEPLTEDSIPIENCKLLTLEYNAIHNLSDCIISNAVIYN